MIIVSMHVLSIIDTCTCSLIEEIENIESEFILYNKDYTRETKEDKWMTMNSCSSTTI